MIKAAGIIVIATAASVVGASAPACPSHGLLIDHQAASTVVTIVPGCLGDTEDLGIAVAELTRQIADAHVSQNPKQNYVAVEEVLVESFVSEILEPSVPAPAN